ncbi:hypothetical protein EVAR_40644_1 [Eumeta japonica]|uniref:Uncharacterized protein n=1 Tax=Eumeta variegata TaxID=151549 RepID=A0A4C1X309_EUMVA|nr:hypothetical protein EVAR_40644_1 [Eumeta japonica]
MMDRMILIRIIYYIKIVRDKIENHQEKWSYYYQLVLFEPSISDYGIAHHLMLRLRQIRAGLGCQKGMHRAPIEGDKPRVVPVRPAPISDFRETRMRDPLP